MNGAISVYEMMTLIGRAKIAEREGTAEEVMQWLRTLGPQALINEYHRATVILEQRGLLSPQESRFAAEYAREWVHAQQTSV